MLAATTVRAQQVPTRRALESEWPETVKVEGVEIVHVQKNVFMLVGGGANVTVQHGDEGVVIVDSGASGQTDRLLAAVRHLTRKPIRYLVNTGPDPDHIGGNGEIVKAARGASSDDRTGRRAARERGHLRHCPREHLQPNGRRDAAAPATRRRSAARIEFFHAEKGHLRQRRADPIALPAERAY